MEFLEVIDQIKQEQETAKQAFTRMAQEEGVSTRQANQFKSHDKALLESMKLLNDVMEGKKPASTLREAITSDDFAYLFGDILDRQLLANYKASPQVYRNFVRIADVSDFREVNRYTVSGADNTLDEVPRQGEYPMEKLSDGKYSYSVKKFGRKIKLAWELLINDDLNAVQDIPRRFGRAAARTESKFATQLYVDANGPHASLYDSTNTIDANPPLTLEGLQTGMQELGNATDENGEPIAIEMVHLVVPPALEIKARNILNATNLRITSTDGGGNSGQELEVENWMRNRVKLSVDPYIPIVASSANGNTSWFLFGDPSDNRPALEMGFLRGHREPEIFVKSPNARRVGGRRVNAMAGDFENDSIMYKIRHIMGGAQMDKKMTKASDGSGS